MSDAERDPSVLVSARLADHAKLILLPNDAARWGWVKLLGRAKLRRPAGEFPNVIVLAHDLGPHARYIDAYLTAGLLERRPEDILVVHDWGRHQSAKPSFERGPMPKDLNPGAERTRAWRIRTAVFERDNFTCRYCGVTDHPRGWLVAEHVEPDGSSDLENLVTACRSCNKRKGRRTPEQAGMILLPQPIVTSHGDTSQSHGDASPRGRASALSPSLSQSDSTSQRNGTDEAAREPEDPAIDYLASVGAHVRADGNGVHRKLVELVRRRGIEIVMRTLADLHEQDFAASGRQLVFGAENALDQPRRPTPITAHKGHTRTSEETAGAWET